LGVFPLFGEDLSWIDDPENVWTLYDSSISPYTWEYVYQPKTGRLAVAFPDGTVKDITGGPTYKYRLGTQFGAFSMEDDLINELGISLSMDVLENLVVLKDENGLFEVTAHKKQSFISVFEELTKKYSKLVPYVGSDKEFYKSAGFGYSGDGSYSAIITIYKELISIEENDPENGNILYKYQMPEYDLIWGNVEGTFTPSYVDTLEF
jgi:predicted heme/steroid binding protein